MLLVRPPALLGALFRAKLCRRKGGRHAGLHPQARTGRIVGVHPRCRPLSRPALPGLRQALLGRAPAEGGLSRLWRRALRDRGAPPRDQGRLCLPQGLPGGPYPQAHHLGREHLRAAQPPQPAGVPGEGLAAGDRKRGARDDAWRLPHAGRAAPRAAARGSAAAEPKRSADQRPLRQAAQGGPGARLGWPLPQHRAPRPCRAAPCPARRRALGLPAEQRGAGGRPAARLSPAHRACRLV